VLSPPTSNLVESGFIWVTFEVKSLDVVKRHDLRSSLVALQLDIEKLGGVLQAPGTRCI
jgi:hypothetical protein